MNRHRRIWLGWLSALVLLATPGWLVAEALENACLINHGGRIREFEIATDELDLVGLGSRQARFAPLESADAVRARAEGLQRQPGREVRLVLYERGVPRTEFTRCVLTRQVLVRCAADAAPALISEGRSPQAVPGRPGWFLVEATSLDGALSLAARLRQQPEVLFAEPQLASRKQKRILPNDPYLPLQWHLCNVGQNGATAGIDIHLTNVWNAWRGAGVIIAVVDDGLQLTHPDIAPNVHPGLHWDFNHSDPDPSPDLDFDMHGTPVAGIAAARGNNGIGVAGVAYESTLVGLRLLGSFTTDVQEAAALSHSNAVIHIKNNSWGPADGPAILEAPGPLMTTALAEGTRTGRGGKGTLYVWAGGNGRQEGENVNYDGYANSIHVVPVAALGDNGLQADYSEPGACLVVTAPSIGSYSGACDVPQGMVTTDLIGEDGENGTWADCELADLDYTKQFRGTSASTPVVSGVIALLLQANPDLNYRDVKEILLRSARQVDASDADWSTNSAGIRHNHRYGAGLVDAEEAVSLATRWANLEAPQTLTLAQTGLAVPILDNSPAGITRSFTVTNENFRVEHATLTVTLPHSRHGDLAFTLISPSGMRSRLAEKHVSGGAGYNGWTLSSVRHWGEPARGNWTVEIGDLALGSTGTLNSLVLSLHGSLPQASLAVVSTNNLRLVTVFSAATAWKYSLEASPDLVNWTSIGLLEMGPSGQASHADSGDEPWRFYRARLVP